MASAMCIIFVIGVNKTHSLLFPAETFPQIKISQLFHEFERRTGVKPDNKDNLRLMFGTTNLQITRDDIEMTFGDYGINNMSTIVSILRVPGGADLSPLKFADITSENEFKPINFDPRAPEWRRIKEGLNFLGTCKNKDCKANNQSVYVQKVFFGTKGGFCTLNYEINQLECPMCQLVLKKKYIHGVGIYKCKLEVKYKLADLDELVDEKEVTYTVDSIDKFKLAHSMNDDDKIEYEYIVLIVTPL